MSEFSFKGYRGFSTDRDAEGASPLQAAFTKISNQETFVKNQFEYIRSYILGETGGLSYDDDGNLVPTGFGALDSASAAIAALGNFDFYIGDVPPVERPDVQWEIDFNFDLDPVVPSDFGSISPWTGGNAPQIGTLPSVGTITIPSFNPSISSIYIPPAPDPSAITEPGDAPSSPGFTYPEVDPLALTLPDRLQLNNVVIPSWEGIDIPTFDESDFPELETMNIDTYISWSEPTYSPEIWTDVKGQIERFFAGGSGIRPEIEEAMLARGRDREDRLVRQQEQQATEEWAGRGYTAPPGMLVKRLDNIREEGLIKKLGLQREVVLKAMDEELANIRLAVQQGIVAEELWIRIHLAATERLFLIERLHIEWEIQKYNLLIEVFKAKFQENLIRAQVFEVRVRAALAEVEVFKALVDAEKVKAEINQTLIQAYTAEIQARIALVEIYKAQVEAVKVQAEVFATEVRAYGTEVEAFASRVNADKLRFDAYESQVRGEAAKANIIEAEARAYQAEIAGIDTGVRAEVAALEGYVSGFRAEVDAYQAALQGHIGKSQVELAALQGNVAGYQADTQRFIAKASAEQAKSQVEISAWESENRLNLGWFEAQLKQFDLTINKIIQQKNIIVEALKASGSLSSTIAAGGLAAMHASAALNAGSQISAGGQESRSVNINDGWTRTWGKQISVPVVEQEVDPGCDVCF